MKANAIAAARFGNRIVGSASVPASQLLANEQNWRIHPREQQDQLSGILKEIGFVQSVIVNKRSSSAWGRDRHVETMIDGHLRVSLALSHGEETEVPVIYVDLTPDEERLVLATFDPIGALAVTDAAKFKDLIGLLPEDYVTMAIPPPMTTTDAKKLVQFTAQDHHEVIVDCADEASRQALIARLTSEGYPCRVK